MSTTKAPVFRKGKAIPEAVYFRQFPGKKRFERVSLDDWNAPLPKMDIAGWGHVGRIEADVRVFSPDGGPTIARKWVSKSYIRNFARLLRNIFGQQVGLVDINANTFTTAMNSATFAPIGLLPEILAASGGVVGSGGNPELAGAGMAIGDGVPSVVHTRNDLVARVGGIYSARNNLTTTALTTSTTTLQITTGVTNSTSASINVTEIGMYLFLSENATGTISNVPFVTLIAYDAIASTPLATGGVIAPRYTMDFPI